MDASLIISTSDLIQVVGIIVAIFTGIASIIISVLSLRQNSKMIEESARPVISIYGQSVNSGTSMFYLVVKNFGNSPAQITKFDSDFADCYDLRSNINYIEDIVGSIIAPGQSRICKMDYDKTDRLITVNLEYKFAKRKFKETFTANFTAGVDMLVGRVTTDGKELQSISQSLQDMLQKSL